MPKAVKKSAPLEKDLNHQVEQWLDLMPGVIWYTRLNSGKIQTKWGSWIKLCKKGTPDYVALVFSSGIAHTLFIECKRKGEKPTNEQDWFRDKVAGVDNIKYLLIYSVTALLDEINELTFFDNKSNEKIVT